MLGHLPALAPRPSSLSSLWTYFLTWSSKFPAVKAGWHQSRATAGGTQQKWAFHGLLRAVTSISFRLRADLPETVPRASFLSVKWMVLSNSCYPGWESEQDLAHGPATKFLPRGCVQVVCIWITLLHTFQEKQVCRLLCGVPAKFHPEILTGNAKCLPLSRKIPVASYNSPASCLGPPCKKRSSLQGAATLHISDLIVGLKSNQVFSILQYHQHLKASQ